MQTIYAVVAMSAETGRFFTVTNLSNETAAEAHAAVLREIPNVAVEVIETVLITGPVTV